ncbi:transglutaminase domain-containing protein [Treponema putidum]|uniref:transglutaminase domain-containing protein n=1 Tax=Treponema putidum TaxID=221027 RepID=UPI003D92D24D
MGNRFTYSFRKFFIVRFFVFFILLGGLVALTLYLTSLTVKHPVIAEISPPIAKAGDQIVIYGENFGSEIDSSWIEIGDAIIQAENCDSWTDKKIVFKYPEYQNGGIVYVAVQNKKSPPSFMASASSIPSIKDKTYAGGMPEIISLDKDFAEVGSIIKISGENFGETRGNSQVLFVSDFNSSMIQQVEKKEEIEAARCSDYDFDFVLWSNEELHVRVPDGADSGMLMVITSSGASNAVPFRVRNKIGTKTYSNKKNFVIAAEVDISNMAAAEKNSMFIKVPIPIVFSSQRDVKILSINPSPFVADYQGASIHQYENINLSTKIHIRQEYSVNTYEVNTRINPVNVRINSRQNKEIYDNYAIATELIPSNDPIIQKTAAEIVQNERNPYNKARRIYNYLLKNVEIIPSSILNSGASPVNALTEKKADTYDTAILFAALARAVGIPAQPIAGITADVSQTVYLHWWAEFYLEGFGWVPVDPGMAKGVPFDMGVSQMENWYFGNLDAFRIAFSRGENIQSPMASNSTMVSKERSYAFYNGWEEYSGITKYNSVWRTPVIIAIY